MKRKHLRKKNICEICGNTNKSILHYHHVIPRTDTRSTNTNENIAIVCPNCHSDIHLGKITIIGIYRSTSKYSVLFFKQGEDPPLPKNLWLIKNNPLVISQSK